MKRFPNVHDTLAEEWEEWTRITGAPASFPPEAVAFAKSLFYSGALAAFAILANGVAAETVFAELEAFANEAGYGAGVVLGHA